MRLPPSYHDVILIWWLRKHTFEIQNDILLYSKLNFQTSDEYLVLPWQLSFKYPLSFISRLGYNNICIHTLYVIFIGPCLRLRLPEILQWLFAWAMLRITSTPARSFINDGTKGTTTSSHLQVMDTDKDSFKSIASYAKILIQDVKTRIHVS